MKNLIFILLLSAPGYSIGQSLSLQLIGSTGTEMVTSNGMIQSALGEVSIKSYSNLTEGLLQGVQKTSSRKDLQSPLLSLEMYPNPVMDFAHLRKDFNEPVSIHVFDPSGRLIIKQEMQNDELAINCQSLPAGWYTIRITHNTVAFQPIRFSKF